MVEVKFPRGTGDTGASPEIRQVLPAGVPSCIPAPTRVRISQAVMANRLLSRVEPVYPPEAQTEHIAGVVISGLDATARHRVIIYRAGKPQQSFGFNFSDLKSNRACLFLNDLYWTAQLWNPKQAPWCKFVTLGLSD